MIQHLRRLLARPPEVVLNIGCAEGYYAVGLARLLPDAHIHAFDIDANARELCGATAALNGVSGRIMIDGRFEGGDFQDFAGRRVLVVCDIEGAELDLLDPVRFSGLAGFDVIVEMHDNPAAGPAARVSSVLVERFSSSHEIAVADHLSREILLPELFRDMREMDQLLAAWEMRGAPTPWGVFTAKG